MFISNLIKYHGGLGLDDYWFKNGNELHVYRLVGILNSYSRVIQIRMGGLSQFFVSHLLIIFNLLIKLHNGYPISYMPMSEDNLFDLY